MNNVFVEEELSQRGLSIVPLNVLHPNELPYSALYIQPMEEVVATSEFVRNANVESAHIKHTSFLKLACLKDVDLVLSPEYSCPWSVVEESIQNEQLPSDGKLWVLGCESITPPEIDGLIRHYKNVIWIYEESIRNAGGNFLDPLCYIFRANNAKNISQTIIIVQFKGQPMADHSLYLERNNLILGKRRYIFRNNSNSIYLTTLICSDALSFREESLGEYLHIPYLILHPQLNVNPRHSAFKLYRQLAFINNRDKQEFICINWARGFRVRNQNPSPFGGSAYYTKSEQLTLTDERVNVNHKKGLYYTTCRIHRANIYFFNYDEHIFFFRTTKPSQAIAKGVLQRKTGPEMLEIYQWDTKAKEWVEEHHVNDGFQELCEQIEQDIIPLLDEGMLPLNKERLLALSNGLVSISNRGQWFDADNLKFFHVKDDEVVRRMTVVQDPCQHAYDERVQYLDNYRRLTSQIITDPSYFPKCIKDLAGNCIMRYPIGENGYNYNLCRNDSQWKARATVAFLGACHSTKVDRVYDELASILQAAQRRLVVWYEKNGAIQAKWREQPPRIDDDLSEDRRSISKED